MIIDYQHQRHLLQVPRVLQNSLVVIVEGKQSIASQLHCSSKANVGAYE